jgi:valyl-tRNA synthetase
MMFGLYAMDGVEPFKVVMLHGMVRDQFGKKMSKSRGNVVDPLLWIEAYGADATRFAFARSANPGADVPIGEEWVQGSRNFCNKLWNATRFALMNGATTAAPVPPREELSAADRWILSRLHATVTEVDARYEDFEFAKLCDVLYHFAWDEVCDWYVELAKVPLARGGPETEATRAVLGHVLDVLLRLLHPVTPFVTEELWTALTGGESIVVAPWPAADAGRSDAGAEQEIAAVQRLVTEVRRFRSEQGLSPKQRVAARLDGVDASPLRAHAETVRALTRLTQPEEGFAPTATLPVDGVCVALDLTGTIDVAAERRRLDKDLAAARQDEARAQGKLGNESFLAKAPAAEVDKIRGRLDVARADVVRLSAQLDALPPS